MKSKINKIIAAILIYNLAFTIYNCEAQSIPNAVNFQAIARNAGGSLITNANVQVKVEVLDGSNSGPVMVTMVYTPTTDAYGQFTFAIGAGSPVVTAGTVANFAAIDWASSSKFIKVSLSPLADNNYTLISNTQATSSFFAFGAKTAEKVNITGANGDVLKHNGTTWVASTWTAPTMQIFTTGSGTYTTPAGVKYIKVRMVGGGGGGSGGGTNNTAGNGTNGGNTTFGTSLLTANGGTAGSASFGIDNVVGGIASLNSPAVGIALQGGCGNGWGYAITSGAYAKGGEGGCSAFGGNGASAGAAGSTLPAPVNTGGGGGGGSGSNGSIGSQKGGCGGGAGGYVEAIISTLNTTYSYSVGSAGAGGSAGTGGSAGGSGGSGVIIVEEYYQ